jgi:DNA-binding NtrC family response regulator
MATVFILEEDQSLRDALCTTLEDEGWPVVCCNTSDEAHVLLKAAPEPFIILLNGSCRQLRDVALGQLLTDRWFGRRHQLVLYANGACPQCPSPIQEKAFAVFALDFDALPSIIALDPHPPRAQSPHSAPENASARHRFAPDYRR